MAEPTRPSTDTDKPATYDAISPTFIMKTDNIANLKLGPQFYKCNITIQDPEMAEDDNRREIILSSHDGIREVAEAERLLQSAMQRLPAGTFRMGTGSRVFIRAVQCIDLTGGEGSDGDGKHDTLENKDHHELEQLNSPAAPTSSQAMREEDIASQPARPRSTSDEPILGKRRRSNTGSSSQLRRSTRLKSA